MIWRSGLGSRNQAFPPLQGLWVVMGLREQDRLWGAGGRCAISLLAPPSSAGIGDVPLESEGWSILFSRLGARPLPGPLDQEPLYQSQPSVSGNTVGGRSSRPIGVSLTARHRRGWGGSQAGRVRTPPEPRSRFGDGDSALPREDPRICRGPVWRAPLLLQTRIPVPRHAGPRPPTPPATPGLTFAPAAGSAGLRSPEAPRWSRGSGRSPGPPASPLGCRDQPSPRRGSARRRPGLLRRRGAGDLEGPASRSPAPRWVAGPAARCSAPERRLERAQPSPPPPRPSPPGPPPLRPLRPPSLSPLPGSPARPLGLGGECAGLARGLPVRRARGRGRGGWRAGRAGGGGRPGALLKAPGAGAGSGARRAAPLVPRAGQGHLRPVASPAFLLQLQELNPLF